MSSTPLTLPPRLVVFGKDIIITAFVSVYVIGSMWLADTLLAMYLPGYVFSGDYRRGIALFFISALLFISWSRYRQWANWRYYIFGGIAVFFPLVFLSSSASVLFTPDSVRITSFSLNYCNSIATETLCGQAFASLVSSSSLRALPAVLTAPGLVWLFYIRPQLQATNP